MSVVNPRLYTYTFFMVNFKFSPGIFCSRHGVHFWHAYPHLLTCLGLETTKQLVLPKQSTITKVQNLPFGIISILFPTFAEKLN